MVQGSNPIIDIVRNIRDIVKTGGMGITYIRTHEGWLYLAVVVELFSRKIIGWSMQPRMAKDIILNALLMAV